MAYQTITLATLRLRLQDKWDGSPFWTTDDANQAINDALLYWNALTGYWRARTTVTIPANDPYASVTQTMLQSCSVSITGQPLIKGSLVGLSLTRPNWRRETITSGGAVPTAPTIWAPASLMMFVIWPAAVTDVQASIDGVRQTPRLTTDADFLDADESTVSAFLGYALHLAALKAPGLTILTQTQGYREQFLLAAADRNAALRRTDWYKRIQRTRREHQLYPVKRGAPDGSGGPGGL